MKYLYLFGLLLSLPFFGFSQREWNNWYFGDHAGITFNSGFPQVLMNSQMSCGRTSVSVSDSSGNLWFYSDGFNVWNRNHMVMPNGSNLHTGCEDQAVSAIQKPGDDSTYYLFTMNEMWSPPDPYNGLHYSVINMRLNGGLGDIEPGQKEIPLQSANTYPLLMTTARHENKKDAWVIVRNTYNANEYAAFLVTALGISTIPVLSPTLFDWNLLPYCNPGTMKVSQDGTKLVFPYLDSIEFCNFNSQTGQVTPKFLFRPGLYGGWGYTEFSVDSRYLYVSTGDWYWNTSKIFQYDATLKDSAAFKQSEILISQYSHGIQLQLAPDWKIYGAEDGVDSMCVINNPNIGGVGCNFQPNALYLNGRNCADGLPTFLQRYYIYIRDTGNCQGSPVHFYSWTWPPPDSVHWNFGDPASGFFNNSNIINATHLYNTPGTYLVHLFVRHIDKRTDTVSREITILPRVTVNLGSDQTICDGDSVLLDAGFCSGCTYEWDNLTTIQMNIANTQTYWAKISGAYRATVINPIGCSGTDTVNITVPIRPVVTNNPLSETICSGESTNIALISNVPGTNFHWTASLTSGNITGFSADSGLIINQLLTNSLPTPGVVTYHIIPKFGSCIGTMVDFPVTVNPGDSVKVSITASSNNICTGTQITFTANPTNPGLTPVYHWKVNGINSGTNSSTFSYTPLNTDVVTCVLTSSNTVCTSNNPATSNSITMTVNPNLPVSVTVTPSQNPVCAGTSVTFTANPFNGGTTPSYQWKVNGIAVGANLSTYSYIPLNGDGVTCTVNSNATCAVNNPSTSAPVTMTVNPNLPVSVSIAASSNPVCSGITVTFTASAINGGLSPMFQWTVNGTPAGINSPTYSYSPLSGDIVNCTLTSSLTCATLQSVSGIPITMVISPAPSVTFSSCFDTITTINAKPIKLKGGIPLNGIYSGPGVNSLTGIYTPAIAGVGTHTITYTYTNVALCSALAHTHIINYPLSIVNCGSPITDIRDNKVYPTIQIGSQCWLATNLNYGTILISSQDQRDNCISEKYCYNDNPINCTNYGGLYQWDKLMLFDETPADQGFCPPGWHIPTENEWNTLFANYINSGFAGSPLKYSGYSGFNALLSGARHINKGWNFQGLATFYWSSTTLGSTKAWAHGMNDVDPSVSLYPSSRANAFSVRCLKD